MATTTKRQKSPRTARLSAIHVLRGKLRLDEETYRRMLYEHTGFTSAGDLSMTDLQKVLDHMRSLEHETVKGSPAEQKRGWMEFRKDDPPLVRKILALWIELGKAGKVEHTTRAAVNTWVKRQTEIDLVDSLTPKQQAHIIEELKAWLERN